MPTQEGVPGPGALKEADTQGFGVKEGPDPQTPPSLLH